MATKTTGNLLPGGVNTPLDARFVVETLAEAEGMQNPVLGGIFYCKADGKHYKITELDSKLVGAIAVADAKIKSYEEFGGNPEEIAAINTSLAGLQSTVNNLPKLSIVQSSTAPENPSNGTIWIPTESIAYSVLDLIAPDPEHVTDIPAWNTVYQATAACWVAVSIVGCAGAVLLGTEAQYVDSHPMGFYVGGGTDSVYSFVFCPKGWFYKAFLSSTTATLSYSHKQIWKCKGA